VQAVGAVLTVLLALMALLGVKWQVDSAERIQREQPARDIFRRFPGLSVADPDLAEPEFGTLQESPKAPAYAAYLNHLVHAAVQSMALDPEQAPMPSGILEQHKAALCGFTPDQLALHEPGAKALLATVRGRCTYVQVRP
jgi:hypothetical protein